MVDDLDRIREADGPEDLVRAYAAALAGPQGADPRSAGRLRHAYLDRRRAFPGPTVEQTPPPLPPVARKPRVRGRLARQERLHHRRFPRKAGTSAMILVVLVFAVLKGIRACERIQNRGEKEKPPVTESIGIGGGEPEELDDR